MTLSLWSKKAVPAYSSDLKLIQARRSVHGHLEDVDLLEESPSRRKLRAEVCQNSRVVRISRSNCQDKKQYSAEIIVSQMKSFVNVLFECRSVQNRNNRVDRFEINGNEAPDEVIVGIYIMRNLSVGRCSFPLVESIIMNREHQIIESKTHWL